MNRLATHHQAGINDYVPALQYASGVGYDGLTDEISLGTPSAADDDAIHTGLDGDALNTVLASGFTTSGIGLSCDSPYGRAVLVSPSGDPGATGLTVEVRGEDYLGQPMAERLTVANGQTTDTTGLKAFYRITALEVVTAATNAITATVGWAAIFGLPYKLQSWAEGREGSVLTKPNGVVRAATAAVTISGTNAYSITAPITGYLIGLSYEITTATTTNPAVMDAVIGGTGQATLDALVPVAAAGFGGEVMLGVAAGIAVTLGDTCVWTSNGGPDAGVADFTAIFSYGMPTITAPVTTDPQTATTGDPRGTYTPQLTPNGTREYFIRYRADRGVNASGNGGLFGIPHFIV